MVVRLSWRERLEGRVLRRNENENEHTHTDTHTHTQEKIGLN